MRDCLHERLEDVVANNLKIIAVTRNLGFFTNSYNYLTQLIPLLFVAPMYMHGQVEFGVVTQSAMAFAQVLGGFSLIISQFETISSFAAVTERLNMISDAIDQADVPVAGNIEVVADETRVAYEKLTLWKPGERRPLSARPYAGGSAWDQSPDHGARRDRQDRALPGDRPGLGERAKGESSGRRAMASVSCPSIRCGSLRPSLAIDRRLPGQKFSDDQTCSTAFEKSVSSGWSLASAGSIPNTIGRATLSAEENRLLAIARVLLAAPRFVFLDRMDGDLTPEQIDHVYDLFDRFRNQLSFCR